MLIAVLAAVASATLYAVASVGQQRAAAALPVAQSMRPSLLLNLARQPLWVGSIGADLLGYVFQAIALAFGPLVLVQPLLVSGLLIALPLGAWLSRTRLRPSEWVGAAVLSAGLALYLVVAAPGEGRHDAPARTWFAVLMAVGAMAVLAVLAARGPQGGRRAAMLGTATGVLYGLTAALTKTSAYLLGLGLGRLLTSWQPYALVVAGGLGLLLGQSAFQAGPLPASLAAITAVDPVASIVIGAVAFKEPLRQGAPAAVLEVAGLAAVLMGTAILSRSRAVLATRGGGPSNPSAVPGSG